MIPIPDLMHHSARQSVDPRILGELLGLAFTGRDTDLAIDRAMGETRSDSPWQGDFFVRDLFVAEMVRDVFRLTIDERQYAVNQKFLVRTLAAPPMDRRDIEFRQSILRELVDDTTKRQQIEELYTSLYDLMNMFKVPGRQARLDIEAFRVDLFRLAKRSIDHMAESFGEARSGLRRLAQVAEQIQQSEDYGVLSALVDYVDHRVTFNIDLQVGASGRLSALAIRDVRENDENLFFRSALGQWWDKVRYMLWHGTRLRSEDITGRLVSTVYDQLAPSFNHLMQILSHLEFYLTNLHFKRRAEGVGLKVCLAEFAADGPRRLDGLFNPLLLSHDRAVVPAGVEQSEPDGIVLLTGPNSGGKTRFLQAIGLSQLLAQSGLFTSAGSARLSILRGMFVSLIEHEAVEHAEGRLGREMERIRTMFDAMEPPSMVILDELCSGTNPSEATQVFSMVLRLLSPLSPVAFISTHFLDYAQQLADDPPVDNLSFLQVEMGEDQRSTYQFVPGVANSSMASAMAERMGVTFSELSEALKRRIQS